MYNVMVGICVMCVQNVDVLKDPDIVKQLGNILKTNVRACKSLGHPYMLQVCVMISRLRLGFAVISCLLS